jgi:hypothetical protein
VTTAIRHLPGFALAILVLALSASLAFAGQPAGASGGHANSHATKTAPVASGDEDTETEPPDADTDEDTETETEDSDSADNCTVDLTQDPAVLLTLNHGSVVCSAAHATDWDTTLYKNKGAWVSHWAKMNHGHDPNKQHGKPAGG